MSLRLPAPLRQRDFRLFFIGQTTSTLGSSFTTVALAFAVLQTTGSVADVGLEAIDVADPAHPARADAWLISGGVEKVHVVSNLAYVVVDGRLEIVNVSDYDTAESRRERVWELTGGQGADIVLELVGRAELLLEGLSYLCAGGAFVEVGATTMGSIEIAPTLIMRGKKRIIGSWMYRPSLLPLILKMMVKNRGKVPYDRITSHRFPLEQANEAFATAEWSGRQTDVIRAVLVP